MTAKSVFKKIVPRLVREFIKKALNNAWLVWTHLSIALVQQRHQKLIGKIRKKETIKVVFFILHGSIWKYRGVYERMKSDPRFNPLIIVCPVINHGEETMIAVMDRAWQVFSERGYHVIKSYDKNKKEWLDVKGEIRPDIVFFSNPHYLTHDNYYISNYRDSITCYVPYGFNNTYLHHLHFNLPFFWYLWKVFYETEIHLELARQYSLIKGANGYVSGYPGMDELLEPSFRANDVWKIKDRSVKRIIWSPHHTIPGMGETIDLSSFMTYASEMLRIAEEYHDKIQITFKPHPLLRPKLYKDVGWGKERTDAYYQK